MKICLVAESYPPALGGVEFALQSLAEGFVQRGHEVWVVTSSWQRHDAGVEQSGSLRIFRVKTLPFFHRFWFILFSLPAILRAARWADVIQGSTFAGGPPAFLGGWMAGKKKSLIVHEVWGKRWPAFEPSAPRRMFYRITEWIIVRLPFDSYVAVSQYTGRCLESMGVPAARISVIHHGNSQVDVAGIDPVEARKGLGFSDGDFVYLTFGRVGISKGFEYFSEAIPKLASLIPHARFVLILSGYDRRIWERVRKIVAETPEGQCKLLSSLPRAELAKYITAADCFVIPSLSEGFGFSALEASHAGKIVVSTDAGALPEVVFGKHVFVKPGSAQALTDGCVRAYNGDVDITPKKEFKWEKTVESYLGVFAQMMER